MQGAESMHGILSFISEKGGGGYICRGLLICIGYLWEDIHRHISLGHIRFYITLTIYSGSYFTAVWEDLTDVLLGVTGLAKQRHEVWYHCSILELKGRRAQQQET